MITRPLLDFTLATALTLMIGWLLVIGRSLILPVIVAIIAVYVLTAASAAVRRLPGLHELPAFVINFVLLLAFSLAFLCLALVIVTTVDELIRVAPTYEANLEALATRLAGLLEIDEIPNWEEIRAATLGWIDVQSLMLQFVSGLTSTGSTILLILVYAVFLASERIRFGEKLAAAFPAGEQAKRAGDMISAINQRIGDYLAVKTLINAILATISYAIMWAMGVDFALFWAIAIGLMNYIPYFGSLIGVMLPVLLSMAQFASVSTTLTLAVLLTAAQAYVGNVLEPRMIGRELNLSPFVVLVSLSLWAALWGLPGAILAIPLTSMLTIFLGSFDQTRYIAILLSERPDDANPR